jgi:hypothetical protein
LRPFVSVCLLFASCSGSQSQSTGTLALSLTDAPAPGCQALYVTIAEVQAHRAGTPETEWLSVCTPEATFNLMELLNGSLDPVGAASLEAGTNTGMRIILGPPRTVHRTSSTIPPPLPTTSHHSGAEIELKVPKDSAGAYGSSTPSWLTPCTPPSVLDFDALHAVANTGPAGARAQPVDRVVDADRSATVSGTASRPDGNAWPGSLVE